MSQKAPKPSAIPAIQAHKDATGYGFLLRGSPSSRSFSMDIWLSGNGGNRSLRDIKRRELLMLPIAVLALPKRPIAMLGVDSAMMRDLTCGLRAGNWD